MKVTLLLLSIILASAAHAADWPTVHGNNQRSGYTADVVLAPYQRAWVAEFPGEIICTRVEAIVADNRVFVGTENGTMYALDAASGKVIWKHSAGPIFHSPAVADGRVFFGDTDGTLWALAAADGQVLWRFSSGKGGFVTAPLVEAGTVFIGSRDGSFYAVEAANGRGLWRYATDGPIRCTAAFADGTVFFASDDMHAYALRAADGTLVWKSEKLYGQSFRDYYPVVVADKVVFRSVLVAEMNDDLNGGTNFLARNAGVATGDWKVLDDFLKSDRTIGTPELIRAEQQAILKRLTDNKFRRTCFILDRDSGRESVVAPVMYAAGNQGCGFPPTLTADGRAIIFYRTVYSNWNLGVKPAVGVGYLDIKEGWITPIRHANGHTPPWNTFWGTCDESTMFSTGGHILYICHQGTLSGLDLRTLRLFTIHGNRDTFGGLPAPPWMGNEWHGPARGSAAVVNDRLYWVTGSRVLCIRGKAGGSGE